MFKSTQELQDFIIWAKSQKIRRVKVRDIEVEISDYAFIDDLVTPTSQPLVAVEPQNAEEILKQKTEEEEALLMWSAR